MEISMKTTSKKKWDDATERKQTIVAERADRLLNDTSFDWLRTPNALRVVAGCYVVIATAMCVLWATSGPIFALIATGLWVVAYIGLRLAVRSVADFPDYVLDERQRSERERGYFDAFRIAGAFAVLLASVALFVVARRDRNGNGSLTLDYEAVSAIFWGTFAVFFGLPNVVLALRQSLRGLPG
jgi:hypothetical protein